jgi:hypothetical protein
MQLYKIRKKMMSILPTKNNLHTKKKKNNTNKTRNKKEKVPEIRTFYFYLPANEEIKLKYIVPKIILGTYIH